MGILTVVHDAQDSQQPNKGVANNRLTVVFLSHLLHSVRIACFLTPPGHASITVSQPAGINSPCWLVVFSNMLHFSIKQTDKTDRMSSPNATSCPRCRSRAHKIRPVWWKRLFFGVRSQYLCSACKYRFLHP